ncbi:MAG: glycosyltransferase [Patescibacteria group bacterium]
MTYDISVIIPCFNESKNLTEMVARLHALFLKKTITGQIILIDDASTDETHELIQNLKKDFPEVISVRHKKNSGIAKAWETGLSVAEGTYVALIDADLQYMPEDIGKLYRAITSTSVDIVHGFRSSIGRIKKPRRILNGILNTKIKILFGLKLIDPTSSFLICKKEVIGDILHFRYPYKFFQILVLPIAKTRGYTISQIEILLQDRLLGVSTIGRSTLLTALYTTRDIFRAFIEFRINHKTEDALEIFLTKHSPLRKDVELSFLRKLWFAFFIQTMPIHHWMISRHAGKYYNELKQSQWLTLGDIKKLQEIKLKKLIYQAYHHIPYYRDLFNSLKLKPSDIQTLDDLSRLPLLTKQNVRENLYFDMLSDNHNKEKILKITTSGSTGEPFVCFADKHQLEIRWASTLRSMEWAGYRFGDKQIRLWHQTLGMSFTQVIREYLDALFNRRSFIPAFEMSDKNLKRFAKKLEQVNPVLVDGYAESFNFLAHYLKNYDFKNIHPKGIISSAQMLPPQSRKIIEEKFGCKVFDKYGSREFSGIAYECGAHDGHHVIAESYIVEILKNGVPAKPGEIGEVVITDLNNYCMPMIRYRVGDLAVAMDNKTVCACGRGLPRIGEIEGRVQAIIVGSNGRYIPGTFFAHFFKDYDHIIRQYQVSQEEVGKLNLKIIKAHRFNEESITEIVKKLKDFLGQETYIELEYVDQIKMVRTGKHQGSISKVKFDFQKEGRDFLDINDKISE